MDSNSVYSFMVCVCCIGGSVPAVSLVWWLYDVCMHACVYTFGVGWLVRSFVRMT